MNELEILYKCIACGHLYQEIVSQCDCLENDGNIYEIYQAVSTGEFTSANE